MYVSARTLGSLSYQYNLALANFITHVNDEPTTDLESFLRVVTEILDNSCKPPFLLIYRSRVSCIHFAESTCRV